MDIGCGPGQLAALLRDKGLPRYVGIDFSSERIVHARRVCPDFDFVLADAFETDLFHTHSYDAVVCTEFLEHTVHDTGLIDKIRPGTRFYGSVPSFPGRGHVRHFENTQEILDRYGQQLQNLSVDPHLANAKGKRYFLMEGIKA